MAVIGATSQLPATQAFPFNGGEELDCAANRSLVVSFVCRSHDFVELNQTLRTHDMAEISPLLSCAVARSYTAV